MAAKPEGALAIMALGTKPRKSLGPSKKSSMMDDMEPDEDEMGGAPDGDDDDEAHGAAADALCRILGVPDAKRAAFQAALRSYVRSCK